MHAYIGDAQTSIDHFQRSIRLNPSDPNIGQLNSGIGAAQLVNGQLEDSIDTLQLSLSQAPEFTSTLLQLILACAKHGDLNAAKNYLDQLLEKVLWSTISGFRRDTPFLVEPFVEDARDIFTKLGLPEYVSRATDQLYGARSLYEYWLRKVQAQVQGHWSLLFECPAGYAKYGQPTQQFQSHCFGLRG